MLPDIYGGKVKQQKAINVKGKLLLHIIHRVHFDPITDTIKVSQMGSKGIEPIKDCVYDKEEALPNWIRRKLAVLKLLAVDESIEDIGWMIGQNIYWVYEVDGD